MTIVQSYSYETEWEAYFLQEVKQADSLKSEIYKANKEIDRMVYELYGLTVEEIGIVEGGGLFHILTITVDLPEYKRVLYINKPNNNFRFWVKPNFPFISIRKNGISKSTII
jgi:hypothetical protein